jgi:hypothetical protein
MKSLTIAMALAAACLWTSVASAEKYYVSDGKKIELIDGDPADANVAEWAVYFFRRGDTAENPSKAWGSETADSPAAIEKLIENDQKFEKSYEKWCGCAWGKDTFFNPLAPVGLLNKSKQLGAKSQSVLEKAHAAADRIESLIERFNDAATLAGDEKLPTLIKGPLADFAKHLHKVFDKFLATKKEVTQLSDSAIASLDKQLEAFGTDLEQGEKLADKATEAAANANPTGAFPKPTSTSCDGFAASRGTDKATSRRLATMCLPTAPHDKARCYVYEPGIPNDGMNATLDKVLPQIKGVTKCLYKPWGTDPSTYQDLIPNTYWACCVVPD